MFILFIFPIFRPFPHPPASILRPNFVKTEIPVAEAGIGKSQGLNAENPKNNFCA